MEKLNAYVRTLVESVGLIVSNEDKLLALDDVPVTMDKLPMVMPTTANLNSMNTIDYTTNKVVEKHKIFNPFAEDEIKKNQHLVLLAGYMSTKTSITVLSIMQELIMLMEDIELQDRMHTTIQKFIVSVRETIGNKGKLVSKKTLPALTKLSQYLVVNRLNIVNIKTARGNTINGIKYTRTAVIDSTALDIIKNKNDDKLEMQDESIGIGDRERDLFISMIDFILPDLKDMVSGSKSTKYPSYIATVELFVEIQTRLNFLLKELKEVNPITYDALYTKLPNPSECEKYSTDIDFLPSNIKATTVAEKPVENTNGNLKHNMIDSMKSMYIEPSNTMSSNHIQQTQPAVSIQINQPQEIDPIEQLRMKTRPTNNHNSSGFYNSNNTTIIQQGYDNYNQAPHQSLQSRVNGLMNGTINYSHQLNLNTPSSGW